MAGVGQIGVPMDGAAWLAPALLGMVGLGLVLRRMLPCSVPRLALLGSISVVLGYLITRAWPAPGGAVQEVARACAAVALVWSLGAALGRSRRNPAKHSAEPGFLGGARVVALLLGAASASIQAVVLVMRVVYVTMDLLSGSPAARDIDYGFGVSGVWTLGFLFLACGVSWAATRDRRLFTCWLWCAVVLSAWLCLLLPPLHRTPVGGFERTPMTLVLLAALSGAVVLAVALTRGQGTPRDAHRGHETLVGSATAWPGLSSSVGVIASAIILLAAYHLAVPVHVGAGGFRTAILIVTVCTALAGAACFALAAREWSISVGDAAAALSSLSLCSAVTLLVPARPVVLAERYPMVFTALLIGFATAAGIWTWLSGVWHREGEGVRPPSKAVRFLPCAKRFAFLNAAMGMLIGAVLAIWPRWPGIAAMDHSIGRVTSGLSAYLFALLVLLWCSRQTGKLTFHILTVLALAGAAGFLVVRRLPFTPQFG